MPEVPVLDLTQADAGPIQTQTVDRPSLTILLPVPHAPACIELMRAGVNLYDIPTYLRFVANDIESRLLAGAPADQLVESVGEDESEPEGPEDRSLDLGRIAQGRDVAVHPPTRNVPRLTVWFEDAAGPAVYGLQTHKLSTWSLPTLLSMWANKVQQELTQDGIQPEEIVETDDPRLHGQ